MLGDDALNVGVLHGPLGEVAVVPARDLTRRVRPHHVYARAALTRVLTIFSNSYSDRRQAAVLRVGYLARREALQAKPFGVSVEDGLVDQNPRNKLLGSRQLL